MKIGIDLVVTSPSAKTTSHKSAWLYLWAHQLKQTMPEASRVDVLSEGQDWDDYDLVFLNHGMEFQGTLNIFGGATDEPAKKIRRLIFTDPKKLVSLDIPMPDYGTLAKGRLSACSDVWRLTDWDRVSEVCSQVNYTTQAAIKTDHLVLGDSHSFYAYPGFGKVSRNDGKTMHGVIKVGLDNMIRSMHAGRKKVKSVTLYFGNIDVRHHLCRFNMEAAIDDLTKRYEAEVIRTQKECKLSSVELVEVLPIENESRKLPQTGFYKGKPFWGTWSERNDARILMNERLHDMANRNGWSIYRHPDFFVNGAGELDFSVMEKPQNVHIARSYYRWDLENDQPNPRLKISDLLVF